MDGAKQKGVSWHRDAPFEVYMRKDLNGQYILAGASVDATKLARLAKSNDPSVRIRVAENSSCPNFVLAELALDSDPGVRTAVALNSSTSHLLLEEMTQDSNPDVRFALASNSKAPSDILKSLVCDENPYVKQRAMRTLELLSKAKRSA